MRVITNLQSPPSVAYNTPVFPQGAWLAITTDDPHNTEFITLEIIEGTNLEEIGQVDPEFSSDKKVLLLRILRQGIDLRGTCTMRINWADGAGQEYSQTSTFQII